MSRTLDAPRDIDRNNPFKSDPSVPALNAEQTKAAVNDLLDNSFTTKYVKIERIYADPPLANQVFSLHSFVPAKGATPDADGVFGMFKFRGTFPSLDEANTRAKFIIQEVDSLNSLLTGYVGRPMPVCVDNKKYTTETEDVDVTKKTDEVMETNIKEQRKEHAKVKKEIYQQEKKLREDVKEDKEVDDYDDYAMLRAKRAQLIWTYNENAKKLQEIRGVLRNTELLIRQKDEEDPSFKDEYMDRIKQAHEFAGIKPEDAANTYFDHMDDDRDFEEQLVQI